MNAREAIKLNIDLAMMCCNSYLDDLSDADLLHRPAPGCNHINWQVGHLLASGHQIINSVVPNAVPDLPAGFAEQYSKDTAASDDPAAFCSKQQLLELAAAQTTAILQALHQLSDGDLDGETPEPINSYAPTVGAAFSMIGSHWMMHSGQWVVVRRQLRRPPLF